MWTKVEDLVAGRNCRKIQRGKAAEMVPLIAKEIPASLSIGSNQRKESVPIDTDRARAIPRCRGT